MEHNNYLSYLNNEQFQNAGYIKIFASDRTWTNPVIDVNVKHKWVREHTEKTLGEELENSYYSGATVFNHAKFSNDDDILHLDLRTAYGAYMVSCYKKPGIRREKFDFFVAHRDDKINLYEIEFRVSNNSPFVRWFINEVAYTKRKVVREEEYTSGRVKFFSSPELNMSDYVAKMLEHEEYRVVSTVQFSTDDSLLEQYVHVGNVVDLYTEKENGDKTKKQMLNESTGWLSRIDKPTYYHMVQTVKFMIMKLSIDNRLDDDMVSVMTDGCYIKITDDNRHKIENLIENIDKHRIKHYRTDEKGVIHTLGMWKWEIIKGSQLIRKNRQTIKRKV